MKRLLGAVLVFAAAGCATTPSAEGPTAECPVCRDSADLACLNVRVNDQTPRAEYQGATYYFCSPQCRDQFVANPAKFVHATAR